MLYLVVQKDTLEKDKIKSIFRKSEDEPEKFMKDLQDGHCIEYQLIAYTKFSNDLFKKTSEAISPYKTNYGIDWYNLNHENLSQVITLFINQGITSINLKSIFQIISFSLKMTPAKNNIEDVTTLENVTTLLENKEIKEIKKKDSKGKK